MARKDIARILCVLKRGVHGEDPRVTIKMIIDGTTRDRLNHIACMETVVNHKENNEATVPEYHFIGSDSTGWNSKKAAIMMPGRVSLLQRR